MTGSIARTLFRLFAGGLLRAFTDGLRMIAGRSRLRPPFSIFTITGE